MKKIVTGRQMSVRESQKEMVEKKLAKFDRIFGDEAEATVTFSAKRDLENIEITIRRGGTLFRSEESAESFATAIDCAVNALLRQIRKNKTRLERQLHDSTLNFADLFASQEMEDVEEETEFKIRKKSFPFKPMTVEEAVLQMNMLDHEFFVFKEAESLETCVVYKQKSGNYGLIVPSDE